MSNPAKQRMRGARLLIECLRAEGVECIFGYPGGAVLHIYDELAVTKYRHLLARHEQGAVHMADGYARATGKVGVALVTSGPALTNAVTGLATAYMDSIPIVVISGQVPTALIGNDAFQEADNVGITRPCTKHNFLVKDAAELCQTMKEAFHIASTGRPGPVLVDIPKDVSGNIAEFKYPASIKMQNYNPTYRGHAGQIRKALDLIMASRKPVVYVGGGAILSNASEEVTAFAEMLGAPVTPTLMGLGAVSGAHPLNLGMLGMHGLYWSNMAVGHCDCLIAVGARFDDRVTGRLNAFSQHSRKIHIDIDPTTIRKNVHVDIPIVGDVKTVLSDFLQVMKKRVEVKAYPAQIGEWWDQIREWREAHPLCYKQGDDKIKPQYVIDKISELTRGEAIVATDVGQHQMWTAQFYRFKNPRNNLTSGGLGTMGYGFPAAIGAQVGRPGELVFAIVGDGGFQMTMQEMAFAVEQRLPIKVAIINNKCLGMVRQWQELLYDKRYCAVDLTVSPDFVGLAEAFGAVGLRATKPDEVVPTIEKALATPNLVVLDFQVDPYENCFPMIPAGAAATEMILEQP